MMGDFDASIIAGSAHFITHAARFAGSPPISAVPAPPRRFAEAGRRRSVR